MDTQYDTDALTHAFSQYIDRLNQQSSDDTLEATPTTDLYSLFVELAVLKSEVKSESRLIKSTVDEFSQLFDVLRLSQSQLQDDLMRAREESTSQRKRLLRPLFIEWLALRDQLTASIENLSQLKPKGLFALFRRSQRRLIDNLLQGQTMTVRKLDERLAAYDVLIMKTLSEPLDPHKMQAVSTVSDPATDNGIVVDELRSGFLWQGELLRYAEVTVNKI